MQSMQDSKRPARGSYPAFLIAFLALGGCGIFIEDGEVNLADVAGDEGPCGIFYACDDYRDRDQGRRENDEDDQSQQSNDGGSAAASTSSSSSSSTSSSAPTGGS